ncbi:vicilin-like seed storage protein At2g18540, partial [Seriola lalandi dorsalis]|uniref:vicilin-like seed storage protein At2g18540 n=1 Tax=Seriola lalandi dorsalis TaxID=1841481 RepID=UPI000C6F833F
MIILSLFIFIWKRQNIIKTQRRQRGETDGGKREREKLMTDDTVKMEDLKKSKGKPQKEEAEQEVETLKSGLETKFRTQTKELEKKQSGMQHALDQNQRMATSLQTQEDERETIKPRLERSRASPAQSSFLPWKIISRQKLQEEQKGREEAESKVQTLEEELKAKKEELERKQAETDEQLKQETQRRTTAMREVETLKNQ